MKEEKINQEIIALIELGCELEDIESLLPDKLNENIINIKIKATSILKELNKLSTTEKWIIKPE